MKNYYILAALLLGCPLSSAAQQLAPTPLPRYYVGVAGYISNYQSVGGNSLSDLRVPIQVTAGYQFGPRLAVQLGVAYSQSVFDYSKQPAAYYPPGGLIISDYSLGKSITRHTAVSLLSRYTLTHQPTRRLQADLLGGITLERERHVTGYQYTAIDSTNAVLLTSRTEYRYQYSFWQLTAGLSTRYRFSSHLEAVLDATLNARLSGLDSPPTLAGALGLRYRFGQPD